MRQAVQQLANSDSKGDANESRIDAEVLLAHTLNCCRTSLYTWPDKLLDAAQLQQITSLLHRRLQGEPIAYLSGRCEFFSMPLHVTPAVLIPRSDTETLVEAVLVRLPRLFCSLNGTDPVIIELGTGSGAIALALASEAKKASAALNIIATDCSVAALAIASANVATHASHIAPNHLTLLSANWLAPFKDNSADIILSNPPYIAQTDHHLKTLTFEPQSALVSGHDGLDDIQQIIRDGVRVGKGGALLALEHGSTQGAAVRSLFSTNGYIDIETVNDLTGHERVTLGFCPVKHSH
ncbi:MAG: peptide chain release factor N(5)-glutamine methyltransferase [Granulosicoccus sp.]